MSKIKICVFTDYHYHPTRNPYPFEGLEQIVERAHQSSADLIMQCGDLTPDGTHSKDFIDAFLHNKYNIPATFCYGNHELENVASLEILNTLFETETSYFYKDICGFRVISLDSNHWYDEDGTFYRYPGNYWGSPKGWAFDQNAFGRKQLDWMKEAIESTNSPCILLGHAPIHKTNIPEHLELMQYFKETNKKSPGKILMYFSGHTHRNNIEAIDGVVHFNVNSANNGEWQPVSHDLYPKEYSDKYPCVKNNADFETPLSAVVTVNSNGHIIIEGSETTYKFGVTPEMFGGPFPTPYGISVPRIDSKEFYLL